MKVVITSLSSKGMYKQADLSYDIPNNIERLIKRIRRFERNSVFLACSSAMWMAAKYDGILRTDEEITRFYTIFIATIGLGKCAPVRRDKMNSIAVAVLSNELNNLNYDFKNDAEIEEIKDAVEYNTNKYPILKKLNISTDRHFFAELVYFGRTTYLQIDSYYYVLSDFIRSLHLTLNLKNEFLKNGYDSSSFIEIENKFFGTSIEKFFKAIFIVHAIGLSIVEKDKPNTFYVSESDILISSEAEIKFDISNSEILKVIERLSICIEDFRERFKTCKISDENAFLFQKEFLLLKERPIVSICEDSKIRKFYIFCPRQLIACCINELYFRFVEFLSSKEQTNLKPPPYPCRGLVYEQYLVFLLKDSQIKRVDDNSGKNGKVCDFIWEQDDRAILIESKVRLRSNLDPTFYTSKSIVSSWTRCIDALAQAQNTKKMLCPNKRCILLIVTEEPTGVQKSQFIRLAKKYNLSSSFSIDAIAICSTGNLEYIVESKSFDSIFEKIESTWQEFNADDFQSIAHDYSYFINPDKVHIPNFLEKTMEVVFPGLYEEIIKKDKNSKFIS